jgi:hypothetical protein
MPSILYINLKYKNTEIYDLFKSKNNFNFLFNKSFEL